MKAYALTDVGRVRQMNQDYQFASTEPVGPLSNLFIVADGMGGHRAGDFASRYLVEHLVSYIKECDDTGAVSAINNGIAKINRELYEQSLTNAELAGMVPRWLPLRSRIPYSMSPTSVTAGSILSRGRESAQITKDHSFVEEMVSMGQMDRDSSEYREKKNIITRAVGIGRKVDVDFFEVPLKSGDYILLCSDGLSNMVDNSAMFRLVLLPGSLQMKAKALVALANQNGGRDNIAVILVDPQISEVSPL